LRCALLLWLWLVWFLDCRTRRRQHGWGVVRSSLACLGHGALEERGGTAGALYDES